MSIVQIVIRICHLAHLYIFQDGLTNIFRYPASLVAPCGGSGATYTNPPFFNVPMSVYQIILATFHHFYILLSF